ncbi:MAG: hypothetical protein K8I03_05505 [Ignavibacteria bacterium]|nr:hypothetical protein [Ignavibacteria bacterium]
MSDKPSPRITRLPAVAPAQAGISLINYINSPPTEACLLQAGVALSKAKTGRVDYASGTIWANTKRSNSINHRAHRGYAEGLTTQ